MNKDFREPSLLLLCNGHLPGTLTSQRATPVRFSISADELNVLSIRATGVDRSIVRCSV